MYFKNEEIAQFRIDTPGCEHRIHLNSAGASLMPLPVIRAIKDHIDLEARIGGYEAAEECRDQISRFYSSAAKLLNCSDHNIAFTANATDSFARAISSIVFNKGDVILTSNEDYISNQITYLAFAKRFGIRLIRVPGVPEGGIDLEALEHCIQQHEPKLVAITHIPTNSGLMQPAPEIGEICSRYDVLYLLDACQSIGQCPLDVKNLHCDFLSVTSRKFLRGPRGAGFLYVSDKALNQGLEPLFIDMRGADWVEKDRYKPKDGAIRFEDWEFAYALLLGTGAAIDYLLRLDISIIEKQVQYLSSYLREGLKQIQNVTIHDKGKQRAALVTFHLKGSDPDFIKSELSAKKINVVTSVRDYAVIDYDEKGVDWTIRVSPHYFNTLEELDSFLEQVSSIAKNRP